MSLAARIDVKGWCPGAVQPMESGDGLLVRVRPRGGVFTLAQAAGLAEIAASLGNGHIDLTRRANLQIRGLTGAAMPELHRRLDRLGLLDADTATEQARAVMVGPFAGRATRALASALIEALGEAVATDRRFAALPAKFGWLVDGDGPLSIVGERADVALCAVGTDVALRVNGQWLGTTSYQQAVPLALAATRALLDGSPLPALTRLRTVPAPGRRRLGDVSGLFGVAAAFGRLEATQLKTLVALAAEAGASEIRLSPWRALYIDAPIEGAEKLYLIVDEADPLLRIDACPGAPACRSASVDTHHAARRLAVMEIEGSIHVSGCAKGCARSAAADLVLVGDRGQYGVIRGGTARDAIERTIEAKDIEAMDIQELLHG